LTPETSNRIKTQDIFNHPWVRGFESQYKDEQIKKYQQDIKELKMKEENFKKIGSNEINIHTYKINYESPVSKKSSKKNELKYYDTYQKKHEGEFPLSNFDTFDDKNEPVISLNKISPAKLSNKALKSEQKPSIKERQSSTLFDMVLNKIEEKNKNKRKKTSKDLGEDYESEYFLKTEGCLDLKKINKLSPQSRGSEKTKKLHIRSNNNSELRMERVSIEINRESISGTSNCSGNDNCYNNQNQTQKNDSPRIIKIIEIPHMKHKSSKELTTPLSQINELFKFDAITNDISIIGPTPNTIDKKPARSAFHNNIENDLLCIGESSLCKNLNIEFERQSYAKSNEEPVARKSCIMKRPQKQSSSSISSSTKRGSESGFAKGKNIFNE
jgi:hypothetical protein